MQPDVNLCRSEFFERPIHGDFLFVDIIAQLILCCFCDFLCRNRTKDPSAFSGTDSQRDRFFLNLLLQLLCSCKRLLGKLFRVFILKLQGIEISRSRLNTLLLWKKHVARISVAYIYKVTFFSKGFYVFK